MSGFDSDLLGKSISFAVPREGIKEGVIDRGEFCDGGFIGYTVYVETEHCSYGSVFQSSDGSWAMGVLALT